MNNPKWDIRFLRLAKEVSTWSKDPSTRVGAVLVSPDRHDVFFGYNGFPSRLEDTEERLYTRELKLQYTIHAEMNAILNAKISVSGFTAYTTFIPCDICMVHLIGAGISRVVTITAEKELAERWKDRIIRTRRHCLEAGIPITEFSDEVISGTNWFDPPGPS
jgi:dCMP deaminase